MASSSIDKGKKPTEGVMLFEVIALPDTQSQLDDEDSYNQPDSWGSRPDREIHNGIICEGPACRGIDQPIEGLRYKCATCPNTNFCNICVRREDNHHNRAHRMIECRGQSIFLEFDDMAGITTPGETEPVDRDWPTEFLDLRSERRVARLTPEPFDLDEELSFQLAQGYMQEAIQRSQGTSVQLQGTLRTPYPYNYSIDCYYSDTGQGNPITRLIDLQPGNGNDELKCSIRSFKPDDLPLFDALLYEAQPASFPKTNGIVMNGIRESSHIDNEGTQPAIFVGENHILEISSGLEAGLRALRYPDRARTLWVDQLCINHKDLFEKSIQVREIGRIFGTAFETILWIGDESGDTEAAFEMIEQLAYRCECADDQLPSPQDVENDPDIDLTTVDFDEWLPLVHFFARPVFESGWVVQEVALAGRVTVKCGEFELEWWKVAALARMLCQPSWQILRYGQDMEKNHKMARPEIVCMTDGLRTDFHAGKERSLSTLLAETQSLQMTDAVDRIFALLGTRNARIDSVATMDIEIDYSKSTTQVFTETAKAIISGEGTLTALAGAGVAMTLMSSLPSWATDWSSDIKVTWLSASSAKFPYSASGDSELMAVWPDETCPEQMWMSSCKIGQVTKVGLGATKKITLDKALESWTDMASQCNATYETGENRLSAFLKTIFVNTVSSKSDEKDFAISRESLDTLNLEISEEDTHGGTNRLLEEMMEMVTGMSNSEAREANQHLDNAFAELVTITRNRTFFITDDGYFGLGPVGVAPGDEVHIVSGAQTPMAFRQVDDADAHHQLVGEIYVHGLMNGEALSLPRFVWSELVVC